MLMSQQAVLDVIINDVDLDHWAKEGSARFLHCRDRILIPFPQLCSLEVSPYMQPPLREGLQLPVLKECVIRG